MVKGIFSSGMSEEDIVRDIISHRVRDDRVKEILMTKTEMNVEEARGMAKVYENIEMSKTETRAVNIIKKTTYAQVTNRGNNQDKYNDYQVQRLQSINDSPRRNEQIRRPPISTSNDRFNYQEQRKLPTVSLKYIARKLYNDSRGVDTKAAEKLTTGQCFCCGERGHRRFECPLKDKCLICGKEGHSFRNCHLLGNYRQPRRQNIACVFDEEQETDNVSYDDNEIYVDQSRERKNSDDPIAFISSVGLKN